MSLSWKDITPEHILAEVVLMRSVLQLQIVFHREEAAISLETMAPIDAGSEAEIDMDEDEFKSTGELKDELQQLDSVSCAATEELSVLSEEISRLKNRVCLCLTHICVPGLLSDCRFY